MRRTLFFILAAIVVGLDQITKYWIVTKLPMTASLQLIPSFLYLARTTNTGAAFGVMPHSTGLLAIVAFVAVVGIVAFAWKTGWPVSPLVGIGLALPLGGAMGNFIDRIRLGYVVDFIELHFGSYIWPNFNVADSSICIGVALLVIAGMRSPDKLPQKQEETQSAP